ncbi:hypothetical protein B296_00013316 [Ensete ventricosum]|uniref:Uncharacterized protein n=1 Tax=Ensete ventricosum TaxID=4639 RepID=A0A427AJW9_ENSVE|nr:hypothetical protein B296_00013316 [Ensete ventricosum]
MTAISTIDASRVLWKRSTFQCAVKFKIGDRVALRKKLQAQVDRKDCVKDCKVDSMYRVWYNLRNTSSNMRFRGPTILVFSGFLSCVHVDLTLCKVGRRCRHNLHPSIPRRIANQKVGMRGEHYSLVDQEPFKDNGVAFEKVFDRYQIFPESARAIGTKPHVGPGMLRPSRVPPGSGGYPRGMRD